MADIPSSPPRAGTPSLVPMKRTIEDDHAPSVSSPLNPDAKPRPAPAVKPAIVREQRERKDSAKKRESTATVRDVTPDKSGKNAKDQLSGSSVAPSPIRYNHPLPREAFHYANKEPLWASHEPEPFIVPDGSELKRPFDSVENKKMYRYAHCVADPAFHHSRYYRPSDEKPFGPRMSFADSDKWFHFDAPTGTVCTNEKGWRMGRANICAREGSFYYEVKVLRGGVGPSEGSTGNASSTNGPDASSSSATPPPNPHIRMGWARREAPLDAPVGFDGYSYGLTDIRMEPMHKSRASKFLDTGLDVPASKKSSKPAKQRAEAAARAQFAAQDHAHAGDVIGIELTLPSLSLHRKVVDGVYNPLIDTGAGTDDAFVGHDGGAPNVVRDRFPVPYKGAMYFESMELRPSKGMEAYGDRGPFARESPDPNHADATLRSLPGSSIKIYKNGRMVGTAFRDLMAFLPPASLPHMEKGVRAGLDDGMVGYYPAVSAFSGGVAQVNFGPDFWSPPPGLDGRLQAPADEADDLQTGHADSAMTGTGTGTGDDEAQRTRSHDAELTRQMNQRGTRGAHVRYVEQIAEDVMYDIIDEVDFYVQDGGGSSSAGLQADS